MRRYLVVVNTRAGAYIIQQATDDPDDAAETVLAPGLQQQGAVIYKLADPRSVEFPARLGDGRGIGMPVTAQATARSNLLPRPTDEKDGRIWDLHMDLERMRETLHDRYVMAAITGLCALQGREPHRIGELVTAARGIADKAMQERA